MLSPVESSHAQSAPSWARALRHVLLVCGLALHISAEATAFVVNSTADEPDIDSLDNVCLSISGKCTLRAAIMQANNDAGADTITLPAGTYLLTRVGFDDTAVAGDLDIIYDVSIQGAGSATTIVDGNGGVTHDRVFHILQTALNVNISGLTIRNGEAQGSFGSGGGLLRDAASESNAALSLNDVVIENNSAAYGGGISASGAGQFSPPNLTLTNTTVRANTATAAGGGLVVTGTRLVMQNGKVYGNSAYQGGGLELENSYGRTTIRNSEIYANTASGFGGGIDVYSNVDLTVTDSYLHDNHADYYGGAIENTSKVTLLRTTLDANSAGSQGGAIMAGLNFNDAGTTLIDQSTLSNNTANFGGGVYIMAISSMTVRNSTISGNSVALISGSATTADGGGVYATGTANVNFFNATIAANRLVRPAGQVYAVRGGGLFIDSSASVTAQNTLIGDNASGVLLDPDDCYGLLHSGRYNLIESTTNTTIDGDLTGNLIGLDPHLGLLQNNGGPTFTQALLIGSPAIDKGYNAALTLLSGTVDSSSTTIAVADASAIPLDGYIIQVDSEQMVATGAGLTVTRGANGTTAATHSAGAAVSAATDQRGVVSFRPYDYAGIANSAGGDGTDIGAFEQQDIIFHNGFEP